MQEIAEDIKVLADPARLQILKELAAAPEDASLGVCDLARRLQISQPNVSHHLRVLKNAGFISCQKNQRFCYYSVDLEAIRTTLAEVSRAIQPH